MENEIPRLTRLTSILLILQSRTAITVKEISNKFQISIRTVYRDIKALEEAGVPIIKEEGKGYSLMEGYNLPPVMFTPNEANTLITIEKIIQTNTDSSLIENYQSIVAKIKTILKYSDKEKLELLSNRIGTTKNTNNQIKSNSLSQIQTSITDQIRIEIKYKSLYKDQVTKREIEPLALYFSNENWIVIAFCNLRNGLREFRLDRILKIFSLNKHFKSKNFSLSEYFIQVSEKTS
jgi:predicted DNA-binding transcriptional regulator YafY